MYGRRNPVLRHFGADELATLGTLHAMEERRNRGEYVGPAEAVAVRPTPEFDEYFEFDRPVPSGLPPNARDLLLEDARSPSRPASAVPSSYSSGSPGVHSLAADPASPSPSPPLGSYNSSPSVGEYPRADGAESGGSGAGSPTPHAYTPSDDGVEQQHSYGERGYAGSPNPDSQSSPARSSGSRGTTPPRRSYDSSPTIQQPPFRSGVPAGGPVRRPGMTAPAAGDQRRRTTSSAEGSRGPSPVHGTSTSRQLSGVAAMSERRPSAPDITSRGARRRGTAAAAATDAAATPRRGLGAKISGRPAVSPVPPAASLMPVGGGAGRRSSGISPSPRGGPTSSRAAGRGRGGGGRSASGGAAAAGARAPAWAPAAGIANMRLEDEDEATRVALMLNDPGVRRESEVPPLPSPRPGAAQPQQQQPQQQQPQPQQPQQQPQQQQGTPGMPPLSPRPSPDPRGQPTGDGASPGYGNRTRASGASEQFFDQYRLRKHREQLGVPDFRFSQPRSHGAHAPLSQRYFSFDEAHPALAEQHYIRSPTQERALQEERRKLQQQRMRAAHAEARSRVSSPRAAPPSAGQLAADVDRLARAREAGRVRLRELEREGETLRQTTRQVTRRALDAIARSEQMTAAASRSPSPGPTSPPPGGLGRSPSRSPSAYYSGGTGPGSGLYSSRGSFGPAGGGGGFGSHSYYTHSASLTPGRYRPASASSGSVYRPTAAEPTSPPSGGTSAYDGMYGYDSPPMQQPQTYAGDAGGGYRSGGGGGGGGAQRPVSAPPTSQGGGGVLTHGSVEEARAVLDMIDSVDRLPQHAQVPVDGEHDDDDNGGGGGGGSGPVVAASAAFSRRGRGGLLGRDEQRIAMGVYDRSRYEEYQRQVDLEMQRRAVEGGYDSDLEREEAAAGMVEDPQQTAAEEEARRRAEEVEREQLEALMEEYRQRLGPEDGYLPRRAQSVGGGGGGGSSPPAGEIPQSHPAQRSGVMSDAGAEEEEELLRGHFVPLVSPELTLSHGPGYASEGPDGDRPHRRTRRRPFFKSTLPQPFMFEERERARPKPISQVKMEQDLAIRRAEEEAARRRTFRAKPVPPAVAEPRYERMMLEAEARRQLQQQQRMEDLAALVEAPFSFNTRDRQQAEEREALARAAKDPNRFQVAFRARPVPPSAREERFRTMMVEMEARREATRRRVEDARRAAQERAAQEAVQRREAADRSYRERLRAVDPALHPHPPKPLGQVPDFNSLHRQFEVHMARTRANLRKRVTVPQEFTLNGSTPDEQTARARKAQERRHRIILDMQLDSELLPEARWPYKSPRGRVRRTPPPPYLVEWMSQPPANRAASARRSSIVKAAGGGAYMTRAEREEVERKVSEKLRAEALRRANRLLKAAQERRRKEAEAAAAAAAGGGGGSNFGLASDVATAAGGAEPPSDASAAAASGRGATQWRRDAVSGRVDNPQVYVEARHAQVERHVRSVVEDTLLEQGIAAYRYVEGLGSDRRDRNRDTDKRKQPGASGA